jgi:hypothetical protein
MEIPGQISAEIDRLEPFQAAAGGFGRAVEAVGEASQDRGEGGVSDKAGLEDDRARAGSAPPQGPGYRESVEQAKGAQRPTSRARIGMVVGRAK